MTDDEKQSVLAEKLDNAISRLLLAIREKNSRDVNRFKIEAKRVLTEYETFVSDL